MGNAGTTNSPYYLQDLSQLNNVYCSDNNLKSHIFGAIISRKRLEKMQKCNAGP
jgi:hypothetical protein